jgi:DNA (cytosine-5)-methyltransferase 1
MTSRDHQALVIPPYLVNMQADNPPTDLREAMPTVLTGDHHYLTVPPFILGSYTRISGQKAALSGVDDPLPTLPGRATHYVVQPGELPKVEDCGFRMLEPAECGRAMAFPDTYVVLGNKRQRVKQYGNAVTPPVMQMLIQRCIESMR